MQLISIEKDFACQYAAFYESCEQIVRRHRNPFRHLETHDIVMIVVQRTLVAGKTFLPERLADIKDMKAFLTTAVRRVFIDLIRKHKSNQRYERAAKCQTYVPAEENDDDVKLLIEALLKECIYELPQPCKAVMAAMLDGCSIAETATKLSIEVKDVNKYRKMAKKKLGVLLYKNLIKRKADALIRLFNFHTFKNRRYEKKRGHPPTDQ
jgi:RNA polymerase sigma factor (sigma-70 family)